VRTAANGATRQQFSVPLVCGLSIDAPVRDATVLIKNRDQLPKGKTAAGFYAMVFTQARERRLLSEEHFAVDGTLVEAWAEQKSSRYAARTGEILECWFECRPVRNE
jgi:transposase